MLHGAVIKLEVTGGSSIAVVIAFLAQDDLVNETATNRVTARDPGYIHAANSLLKGLEQRHEIPDSENMVLHEDSQSAQPPNLAAGEHYWQLAHAIDNRPVVPDREAKSISHEMTFAEDIDDTELLRVWLVDLAEQVSRRVRHHDLKGRTAELKVRFADFTTISRSLTLQHSTNVTQELLDAGIELLTNRLPSRQLPVRLLGFGVTQFDGSGRSQQQLFDRRGQKRSQELDSVADQITARFGKRAIRRGAALPPGDV
jgi:hypothetical protein